MHDAQPSLLTRDDTLLGVCEALAEDFGFNPLYLRLTLTLMLFWNPMATTAGYVGAAAVVLLTRLIAPNPRPTAAAPLEEGSPAPAVAIEQARDRELEPLAA